MAMSYEQIAASELKAWQKKMSAKPGYLNRLSKRMQTKINSYIPEKIHKAITNTLREMIRGVLFGYKYITREPVPYNP